MRRTAFLVTVFALMSGLLAASAQAGTTIRRNGSDYSGVRNPGNCEVAVENGTELHVKCTQKAGADGPAFVRYRFLTKDGFFPRWSADVYVELRNWVGECSYRWMVAGPRQAARTLRVKVPAGAYCHIVFVEATPNGDRG